MTDRFAEPLAEALRHVHVFADLDDAARQWLADRMDDQAFEAGAAVFRAGDPADHMAVLVAGEVHIRRPGRDEPFIFVHEGDVSGVLPYSRMTTLLADAVTVRRSRVARLHRRHFADLLREHPPLGERLVWLMADRIREFAVNETHREKLMALGKLSAGLAHELNNPAAAVQRAASQLCTLLGDLQRHAAGDAAAALADRLRDAPADSDPLARSDRERRLRQWSRSGGFDVPRDALTALADAGIDAQDVEALLADVARDDVPALLVRVTMAWRARGLVDDIEEATSRIAGLVRAIKEYAYRDEMPVQAVDVRESLERTLLVFTPRTRHHVQVVRSYVDSVPVIQANAGELTQVWTNLLDNALDAMRDRGTLRIGARVEGDAVVVEVGDSGPGIPADIARQIFEPFFTTKALGEGTGLGLDIVRGIVRRHRGSVRVLHSEPGDTVMQVRLPLAGAAPRDGDDAGHA